MAFTGKIVGKDIEPLPSYDFVVVGGGTAGLVLANRLSEDLVTTVLVLEAGQLDQGEDSIYIPGLALGGGAIGTKYDWNLTYAAQPGLYNRTVSIPQGHVVGGSTVLNILVFDRGSKVDYDRWKLLSDDSWGWDELLPYFRKSESFTPPSAEIKETLGIGYDPSSHGYSGPVHSSYPPFFWPSAQTFVPAFEALGIKVSQDGTNGNAMGAFWSTSTTDPATERRSTARTAYYDPVTTRPNLHLLTGAQVTRLITNSDSGKVVVTGVEYSSNSKSSIKTISSKKEVILAAGTFHTPKILQLSGVGHPDLLSKFNIPSIVDLPGVGANLQDHTVTLVRYTLNLVKRADLTTNATFAADMMALYKSSKTGPYTTTGLNQLAFLPVSQFATSTDSISKSNIAPASHFLSPNLPAEVLAGYEAQSKILMSDLSTNSTAQIEFIYADGSVSFALQHPLSRGSVQINSADPFVSPLLDPRYVSHPTDLAIMVEAFKFARKLIATPAVLAHSPNETVPGLLVQTDAEIEDYIRKTLNTVYHPVGTASMMRRELGGVVDSKFMVYGVQNLRVVDASVIPLLPASHLQATVYAVAEKAADEVKKAHAL